MKTIRIIRLNILILCLCLSSVKNLNAQGNINLIDKSDNVESRLDYQNEQRAKNIEYQSEDDTSQAFTNNSTCNQNEKTNNPNKRFLGNALENERLEREQNLLDKFGECLFNDMTEANVLAQRDKELNNTLGDIGSFSGFGTDLNGEAFDSDAYDKLRAERSQLSQELGALRKSDSSCFPSTSSAPDYCSGKSNRSTPEGCENQSAYQQIKTKSRRLEMIEGDFLALEEKKKAADILATGDDNISSAVRKNLEDGANHLDYMENWERAKGRLKKANKTCGNPAVASMSGSKCPTFEKRYKTAYNNCYQDNGRPSNQECKSEVQQKHGQWQAAKAEITAANQEVKMWFGKMASRSTAKEGEASDAASRDGGAKAGVTLDAVESSGGAYGPFLGKISSVIGRSKKLYSEAMENLKNAQENLKARKNYTDDFDTFALMRTDYNDESVKTKRDIQLLISDLGLMATASSGAQAMRCREIGYNKDTKKMDFRPNCPNGGSSGPPPSDFNSRMSNPNATFKQCYVRSYDLFRAASAMYLAAEINAKENMNKIANECLMRCVATTDTKTLSSLGIDPKKRKPNCMVRLNKNDPTSEVEGILVHDGNAQDDKNEQMAALERAANLYSNMVSLSELKSATKDQALDMYNVAYQAAMEEMTAKTQRVATAQANLDAARAALRATNASLNLIIAAIAAYVAVETAMRAICPAPSPPACQMAAKMAALIAAALLFKGQMEQQKEKAQKEVAYWMEELKDAQLHGHMACNYPGLNKNYKVLSDPSLIRPPTKDAIGLTRKGTALKGVKLGDAELGGKPAPLFNSAGKCIKYCEMGEVYIPPESDLYNAVEGNPDLDWAVNREKEINESINKINQETGECQKDCEKLDITAPITGEYQPFDVNQKNPLFHKLPEQENYVQNLNHNFIYTQMEKYGVLNFLEFILFDKAHASNLSIIENNTKELTSSKNTSKTDKDLGLSLGMPGLNSTTDFSYFLAMKVEALKMQTLDNTKNVDLQKTPVSVDHLIEWNGSDCSSDKYKTTIEDKNSTGANGIPSTQDVNNRNSTIGCGPEMHLEDFADSNERNTSTFPILPYMNELPEKTGFPLPETRHVYVMSVIRQIQKNMMLHAYRVGDCKTANTNTKGDKILDSAGSGSDNAPSTICGMANRYAQLVRYARRQMSLKETGLDEVPNETPLKTDGVCLKFSNQGNPIPDPDCQCRLNNTCVKYSVPTFGNFSTSATNSGTLALKAANETLEGNLEGAGVAAAELSSQSNALRRSLRDTKKKFKQAAFGSNQVAAKKFFDKNPILKTDNDGAFGKTTADFIAAGNKNQYSSFRNKSENPNTLSSSDLSEAKNTPDKQKQIGNKEANLRQNNKSAVATGVYGNAKPFKHNFYAGSDIDLNIDGIELDDDISLKGAADLNTLYAMRLKEQEDKDRIERSFAGHEQNINNMYMKKNSGWDDAIHLDTSKSLFKIISRRYRKTAYPLFIKDQ